MVGQTPSPAQRQIEAHRASLHDSRRARQVSPRGSGLPGRLSQPRSSRSEVREPASGRRAWPWTAGPGQARGPASSNTHHLTVLPRFSLSTAPRLMRTRHSRS